MTTEITRREALQRAACCSAVLYRRQRYSGLSRTGRAHVSLQPRTFAVRELQRRNL
ncbi:MAG: hypothetical protein M3O61_07570 [Gemmatimonadota bacterium]|nr:hypothetical protein [Gemmatimonadota bacterium]